jgi:hypothetical protein
MKRTTLIPPHAATVAGSGSRQAPSSKHAGGRKRGLQMGAQWISGLKPGQQKRVRAKAARKAEFLAQSSRQGKEIAKEKADKRTYARWFAGLSQAEQAWAKERGLHKPMPEEGFRRASTDEDALALAEHEPIPEGDIRGNHNGRPVIAQTHEVTDVLEPITPAELAHLSADQVSQATEDFAAALGWALEVESRKAKVESRKPEGDSEAPHYLVEIGLRAHVVIATMAPEFSTELPDPVLARGFLESFADFRLSETLRRLQETGEVYRRLLEWLSRGSSLSGLGERLQLVAFNLRPDLIDGATNQALGEPKNKSRQALNKVLQCIRDTFAGIRARCMRDDSTRLACQHAQGLRPSLSRLRASGLAAGVA